MTPEQKLYKEGEMISDCCEAEIEVMESEMPDSGFRFVKHYGYRCLKCNKPCNLKHPERREG